MGLENDIKFHKFVRAYSMHKDDEKFMQSVVLKT
jgi:hypothetical protein